MTLKSKTIHISTHKRSEMVDITDQVQSFVTESGAKDGEITVFCPHTTAAITINENADPSVVHDVLTTLEELIPQNRHNYQHAEGNSDAHIKSSLVGCSEHILVKNGQLVLGTWQGVYFCEFDGPRSRKAILQIRSD